MKTYFPNYYNAFSCKAEKCSLSCCSTWEISVDGTTCNRWKKYGLQGHIEDGISGKIIALCDNGNCPFLSENKLCNMYISHGEEAMPEACRIFPREEHFFRDRCEKTLLPGCEAVLELLWNGDGFEIHCDGDGSAIDNELFRLKQRCIDIISDDRYSLREAMRRIYALLTGYDSECEEMSATEIFIERNSLVQDVFSEYCEKGAYPEFVTSIYEYCEDMLNFTEEDVAAMNTGYRDVRIRNDEKLRLLIAEEIAFNLVIPGMETVEDMILKYQWLAIQYACIVHCGMIYNDMGISDLTGIVTHVFRMTGYTIDDIEDYLRSSFEKIIWGMDYFNMIIS